MTIDRGYVVLAAHVKPRASVTRVTGFVDDVLHVDIQDHPTDGKANDALVTLLARKLQVRRNQISIQSGKTGRNKLIRIRGIQEADLSRWLSS
ncbi:MAG: DUF167 domain-containing protein [Actinobacteria bacterium]|nr:DUF167 domain-containing protein [Actinomycetota bacterium]MCL5445968.1 DUF167 domain-containing protein [Actinomycetota bacterium]